MSCAPVSYLSYRSSLRKTNLQQSYISFWVGDLQQNGETNCAGAAVRFMRQRRDSEVCFENINTGPGIVLERLVFRAFLFMFSCQSHQRATS